MSTPPHGTAIVLGASRGIGAAVAERFAGRDGVLVVAARSREHLEGVAERVRQLGGTPEIAVVDITDREAVAALVEGVQSRHGPLRVLLNCAGGNPYVRPAVDTTAEQWDELIALNLTGPFFAAAAAGRLMRAHRLGGVIVNVTSVGGHVPVPNSAPYLAAKAALDHLTRCLALELGPYGVRVNAVAPGFTATDVTAGLRARPGLLQGLEQAIPLGRLAQPDEIADAMVFAASSPYLTGAVLTVDGGYGLPRAWPALPAAQ